MGLTIHWVGLLALVAILVAAYYFRGYLYQSELGRSFLFIENISYIPRMANYMEHILFGIVFLFLLFAVIVYSALSGNNTKKNKRK